MSKRTLSLCMIVKNEERNLARCLDSVRGLVTEIIIVDTGSSDATPQIAAARGADVYPFDFSVVDFSAARNHALAHAGGDWILVLDADETLDPAGRSMVSGLANQNENAGYYFERLNRWSGSSQITRDYVVRLFPRRPGCMYRGRVHETVDASVLAGGGRLIPTSIRISHEFASDSHARRCKNLLYMGILLEELAADPRDTGRLSFLAAECHQLGLFDQAASILEQIACIAPRDPQLLMHSGVYHLWRGEADRARAAFLTALSLNPDCIEAQSFLRSIATNQNNPADAPAAMPVAAAEPDDGPKQLASF
jgi:glycosyltransferase involved in cell wall biosynthesis